MKDKLAISVLILSIMLTPVCWGQHEKDLMDSDVVIFSGTHAYDSRVAEKKGNLEIEIYSVHPIEKISVNGQGVKVSDNRQLKIAYPYSLKENTENFKVVVKTNKGIKKEVFRIRYQPDGDDSDWFRLVAMVKQSRIDNMEKVGEGKKKESANKTTLLLIPRIFLELGRSGDLEMRAVLLREKYGDAQYEEDEVVYNQLATYFHTGNFWFQKLSLGIGYNDIAQQNGNSFQGENDVAVESFFNVGIFQPLTKRLDLEFGVTYTGKDSKTDYSNEADDEDGREIASSLELRQKTNFGTIGLSLDWEQYDADGDYKDTTTISYGTDYSVSIGPFLSKLGVDVDSKSYKNENFTYNKRRKDKKTTLSGELNYRLLDSVILGVSYYNIDQTSNIDGYDYLQNRAEITAMFIW